MSVQVEADESGRGIGRGAEGGDIERMDSEEIAMRLKTLDFVRQTLRFR